MPELCLECSSEVMFVKDADWEENKIVHTFPLDEKLIKVLDTHNIPFRCKSCRSLNFPLRANLDRVMVLPDPLPETTGKAGIIIIPIRTQYAYEPDYGTVLAVGKGYVNKKGKFIPTEVKVGDRVCYDKSRPSKLSIEGSDGKTHDVKLLSEQDVHGIIEEQDADRT